MTGIERLRKLSGDLIHRRLWVVLSLGTEEDWGCFQGDGRTVNDELLSIANQIEREHAEDCFRMGERAAEDAEAIAWVRERGGLDERVTTTKPEPPDSLERIADEIDRLREEVALHLGDYLYDEDGNDSIQFSMELVAKRCRALAERGER